MDTADQNSGNATQIPAGAIAALQNGNKIEAIKIVRMERNIGLKEAKDAVEAYVAAQPALQATMAAAQKQGAAGLLRWLIVLALLGIVAWQFLGK